MKSLFIQFLLNQGWKKTGRLKKKIFLGVAVLMIVAFAGLVFGGIALWSVGSYLIQQVKIHAPIVTSSTSSVSKTTEPFSQRVASCWGTLSGQLNLETLAGSSLSELWRKIVSGCWHSSSSVTSPCEGQVCTQL